MSGEMQPDPRRSPYAGRPLRPDDVVFETLEPQPNAPGIIDVETPPVGPTDIRYPRSVRYRDSI